MVVFPQILGPERLLESIVMAALAFSYTSPSFLMKTVPIC